MRKHGRRKFELPLKKKNQLTVYGVFHHPENHLTLASHCEIMVLDEPVLGIDSLYREMFYDALLEYHQKHKNLIIIATHLIDEVERVLENVVVISKGTYPEGRSHQRLRIGWKASE